MTVAVSFEKEIRRCLPLLGEDAMALSKARYKVMENITTSEALRGIGDVLKLALLQEDHRAFGACCKLVIQLAARCQRRYLNMDVEKDVLQLKDYAERFGFAGRQEVKSLAIWFQVF